MKNKIRSLTKLSREQLEKLCFGLMNNDEQKTKVIKKTSNLLKKYTEDEKIYKKAMLENDKKLRDLTECGSFYGWLNDFGNILMYQGNADYYKGAYHTIGRIKEELEQILKVID